MSTFSMSRWASTFQGVSPFSFFSSSFFCPRSPTRLCDVANIFSFSPAYPVGTRQRTTSLSQWMTNAFKADPRATGKRSSSRRSLGYSFSLSPHHSLPLLLLPLPSLTKDTGVQCGDWGTVPHAKDVLGTGYGPADEAAAGRHRQARAPLRQVLDHVCRRPLLKEQG